MTPEHAEKYFVKHMTKWGIKFGVPLEEIARDNRMWFSARVKKYYGKHYCWYNSKHLAEWETNMPHIIFHELGHLKNYIPYTKSIKKKVKSENIAEKFALQMLKKYYPKLYKKRLKRLPKKLKEIKSDYPKEMQYYYDAFKTIKEYQGVK